MAFLENILQDQRVKHELGHPEAANYI